MLSQAIPRSLWVGMSFLVTACCSGVKPAPPRATLPDSARSFGRGEIVELHSGRSITFAELATQIRAKDIVLLGEVHDNPDHHLVQIQVFRP